MNIFVTSNCPIKCAKYLDNSRVNKMTVETAQMLSTAIYCHIPQIFTIVKYCDLKTRKIKKVYYIGSKRMYTPTHINHSANRWLRENRSNYRWSVKHFEALCKEYTRRSGKIHASQEYLDVFNKYIQYIPNGKQTPFVNCAANNSKGISYKHIDDTIKAYQLYLNDRWDTDKREPKWN